MKIVNIDYAVNLNDCVTWQYENTTKLKQLINYKNAFNIYVREFIEDWYQKVFNLETASYFGLIIWTIILSHTNYVQLRSRVGSKSFGFGPHHKNFFESNFGLSDYVYTLKTEELRQILTAQCYNLQSNGSLYDLNHVVNLAFPNHGAYVEANYETRILTYHFPIALSDGELSIAVHSNILQSPIGMKRRINNGEDGGE